MQPDRRHQQARAGILLALVLAVLPMTAGQEQPIESPCDSVSKTPSCSQNEGAAAPTPEEAMMSTNTKKDAERQQETTEARLAVAPLVDRLAVLDTLTVAQLQAEHARLFGEPTRSRNKQHLAKRLAWKIQEQAEGGLTPRALDRIDQLATDAPARWRQPTETKVAVAGTTLTTEAAPATDQPVAPSKPRDPRLPAPGTTITKIHQGVEHKILVLEDGFEHLGVHYKSLSAIAKVVTGTFWNGFLWAGLTSRKPAPATEPAAAPTPDADPAATDPAPDTTTTEEGSR